jgi:hypothetical protein
MNTTKVTNDIFNFNHYHQAKQTGQTGPTNQLTNQPTNFGWLVSWLVQFVQFVLLGDSD